MTSAAISSFFTEAARISVSSPDSASSRSMMSRLIISMCSGSGAFIIVCESVTRMMLYDPSSLFSPSCSMRMRNVSIESRLPSIRLAIRCSFTSGRFASTIVCIWEMVLFMPLMALSMKAYSLTCPSVM